VSSKVSRSYKSYTGQFKQQAMDLVRVQGLDPAKAARDLGIPTSTLFVWLKKDGWVKRVEPSAPLPDEPQTLKVRIADLERQVRRLETEKEILKKSERIRRPPANATAYFASHST
jgi:transposase